MLTFAHTTALRLHRGHGPVTFHFISCELVLKYQDITARSLFPKKVFKEFNKWIKTEKSKLQWGGKKIVMASWKFPKIQHLSCFLFVHHMLNSCEKEITIFTAV